MPSKRLAGRIDIILYSWKYILGRIVREPNPLDEKKSHAWKVSFTVGMLA